MYSKDDKSQLNLRDIFHQTIRRAKVRQNEKKNDKTNESQIKHSSATTISFGVGLI